MKAFSAFYYVIDALLQTTTPTIDDIDNMKDTFCKLTFSEVGN